MKLFATIMLALGVMMALTPAARAVEEPEWTLVHREGAFEVRDYASVVLAETQVTGDRGSAVNEGFRRLARYIFGGNTPHQDIAMTAPVMQQERGRKITMTAPVTQAQAQNGWTVAFVMPRGSSLEAMPEPLDRSVVLREQPARRVAALRFTGFASQDSLDRHAEELRKRLLVWGGSQAGPATYAFYDPPWTLPWARRNEVMVELR